MARIRTVKPDFFLDEELADLPFAARILYIGLWCLADREGRLEDRPKKIKAQLFPWDNIQIEDLLCKLHPKHIIRYEVEGQRYIWIITFKKHQRPHTKEAPSQIPEYKGDLILPGKGSVLPGKGDGLHVGKGREGKGIDNGNGEGCTDSLAGIPEHLHSVWPDWVKFRKEEGKTLKATTIERQLKHLAKYPADAQIECIETSIRNQWTGLFPDKISVKPKENLGGYRLLNG